MRSEFNSAWRHADVVDALCKAGLPAEATQTGGMNLAIMVNLEAGFHLLINDFKHEDALVEASQVLAGLNSGFMRRPPGSRGSRRARHSGRAPGAGRRSAGATRTRRQRRHQKL